MSASLRNLFLGVAALLLALAAAWFLHTHERRWTRSERFPPALSKDRWTLARVFLAGEGFQTHSEFQFDRIMDSIGPRDVLLLDIRGEAPDPPQVAKLREWVRSGGHLILSEESLPPWSCVLDRFGVSTNFSDESDRKGCSQYNLEPWEPENAVSTDSSNHSRKSKHSVHGASAEASGSDEAVEEDGESLEQEPSPEAVFDTNPSKSNASKFAKDSFSEGNATAVAPSGHPQRGHWTVDVPRFDHRPWRSLCLSGSSHSSDSIDSILRAVISRAGDTSILRVDLWESGGPTWNPKRHAPGRWADPGGFAIGGPLQMGSIVVVRGFWLFTRTNLSESDHGNLLLRLTGRPEIKGTDSTGFWVVQQAQTSSWIPHLARKAPLTVAMALVLLCLAMWAAAVRTVPLQDAPPENRTGVVDHAEGAGRWLWQFPSGRMRLRSALADLARAHVLRAHPEWAGADPQDLAKFLSGQWPGDSRELQSLLSPPEDTLPQQFLSMARALWTLRRIR